jgi:mono/diheme cytochrome c family protein
MLARMTVAVAAVIAAAVAIPDPRPDTAAVDQSAQVRRGKDLVWSIGCNDCHTPKKMGPNGPVLDEARLLSGHRETPELPAPPPVAAGPWAIVVNDELTAWSGPWGITYAQNLTPDENTGLGIWTEEMFVQALRTGRHMGVSRRIQPPMPWEVYGRLPDQDLKAIYAYLRTIPAVHNRVPLPVIAGEPSY